MLKGAPWRSRSACWCIALLLLLPGLNLWGKERKKMSVGLLRGSGRTRSSPVWERRCSSARRPARSSVTAAICRARSVGGDVSCRGWRAAGIGERTNGGGEGASAGPRCGVGDSGVDARLRGGVGGSGRGVVVGLSVIALRSGGGLSSSVNSSSTCIRYDQAHSISTKKTGTHAPSV
jgi:hypothetical protein